MAIKSYYLDKRTLVSGEPSYQKYDNNLNLKEYISEVSVPYTLPNTIEVDTIDEATANTGVTIESVNLQDGGLSNTDGTFYVPFYPAVAQNNITAGTGGAIIVTNYLTTINTDAGGDAFTLANGIQRGQLKKIQLVVDGGGDAVITPATPMVFGYTTITMNDAGDFVILQWSGSAWFCIENSGATLA
jgi:hypothetical protein